MKINQIDESWKRILEDEFSKPYFISLASFLDKERMNGKVIFPTDKDIFKAFELTPLKKIRVLILGQDPYHGLNQAQGLSFSVPIGTAIPPSLKNIYKELENDLGILPSVSGDLTHWAQQGVFMLNSILTVEANQAGSHSKIGWQQFTDAIIHEVSQKSEHVVFLLWGQFAARKRFLIDESKHAVFVTSHPSPLSYYQGFKGCRHFSATNQYLLEHKKKPIRWG